jgi:hypothetical protein
MDIKIFYFIPRYLRPITKNNKLNLCILEIEIILYFKKQNLGITNEKTFIILKDVKII